jgi:uncharacterized repeat protein (TIGR03806 family)
MLYMKRNITLCLLRIFIVSALTAVQSCQMDLDISPDNSVLPITRLSEYNIYQGNPSDLIPNNDYKLYELNSQLFTDYAEKQRLIKLPLGARMTAINNALLGFPEGTIIVKTFYYFKDKRNPSNGKKLIETRILELKNGKWLAGTYMWNDEQTEAFLINSGLDKTVNWVDEKGIGKVISYHIPGNLECRMCHNSNNEIVPIGPKTRNLNFEVMRNNVMQNQLTHLINEGTLNSINPSSFTSMPNFNNQSGSLSGRGRAYLDINCSHCHNANGVASKINYRMDFETDLGASKIREGKDRIKNRMMNGDMPKIGATVIDEEGVLLIKEYLETL